ncbi:hypothetical protein FRC09_019814 [Ceratobasidium sp. 395]|nr:hypothetical protein FRC09_019814 [Ceratobasidium sp. 395]
MAAPEREISDSFSASPRDIRAPTLCDFPTSPSTLEFLLTGRTLLMDEIPSDYAHQDRMLPMNGQCSYDGIGSSDSRILEPGPSSFVSSRAEKPLPPLPIFDNSLSNEANARFRRDGRVQLSFDDRFSRSLPPSYCEPVQEFAIDPTGFLDAPRMNINIMIVGSRGDVQPYLALGQRLRQYGHNVRVATHATFRQLVKDSGLRFFNIGGDPHELMSYMVRNPGLIPGFESLRNGDIAKKQKMVGEILEGCFQSCFERDDLQDGGSLFAADAIISNPPTFAHIHCAEALGIPLLLSFTMPWCATTSFPHPLVNIKQNPENQRDLVNYYSYLLVDIMTWQGLGHTINKFRMQRLGLPYLNTQSAVSMIERCKIPWTYCLSSALVPKPSDWMSHIDVVGFYFLDLANGYTPPADLESFISNGKPPIYIGLGSIVLENPRQITQAVLSAVALSGVRAIISPGWGGLDKEMIETAGPNVFALGNVPHDWLFERVSVVCHHGGAGTTAIGLKCGKPTIIVPFFGDQPWWAAQIARRGAGPDPIYPKRLTAESLAAAIKLALSPDMLAGALAIGSMIKQEDGAVEGMKSFHRHLPLLNMRCELDPKRVAVWYSPKFKLRLSAFAAQVLEEHKELKIKRLKLHRPREYDTHVPASDPITGALAPSLRVMGDIGRGLVKVPSLRPDKGVKKLLEASTFGSQAILQGVTEGLLNTPKLYGSEVRSPSKVNGLGSGIVQGIYGVYDGLTDLVKEPIKGQREHGVFGAAAGLVIGSTNCVLKPLAGAMAAVSLPLEGTAKSAQTIFHKKISVLRRATKRREGLVEFRNSSQAEQDPIIQAFGEYKARQLEKTRKGKNKEKAP